MSEFKERLEKIKLKNTKLKHRKHTTWPIEKRIEVVSQYLVLGNMKIVAATCGVDYGLLRQWKMQPWWAELEAEIRATQNIEMDTKLSRIVDKSLDSVLDRVENGDFFYDNKTGQIKRKPVNLRDVARVSVDILSKRELLRGNATDRKETTQVSVNEQLKLLAAEFAKWQTKAKPVIDVEMVEVIEPEDNQSAVHDEWETRLQEGSSEVHEPSGSNQEEDGAERSSSGNDESGESHQG